MSTEAIPFGRPMLSDRELDLVKRVLSGSTLVHGPMTKEFEEAFAARVGASHAISVSSCTAGLHLSLLAMGVGPGDEVIVPAMTHVATAHAVEYRGAKPIFVDVLDETGNIDGDLLAERCTSRTKVLLPVHYLGLPCDMDKIWSAARSRQISILEDCALAVDASYGERRAGTLGDAGAFSFYPVKHMTTVEGGMVTTNDELIANSVRKHRAFGYDRALGERARPGIYDVDSLGFNYRMNEVEAAVGIAQLEKLAEFQSARELNYKQLYARLEGVEELKMFPSSQGKAHSSHYCFNVVLPKDGSVNRDDVVRDLAAAGIGSSVHYPCPVPLFSFYREKYGYREGQYPVAEWMASQTISLPVGPHLPEDGPVRIASALTQSILKRKRKSF